MKSSDYRNLSILSHLGGDLEPGLTLTSVTPYTVNWKDVAIHMCHVEVPRTQVMYALNANLVALCEGDITKVLIFSCLKKTSFLCEGGWVSFLRSFWCITCLINNSVR